MRAENAVTHVPGSRPVGRAKIGTGTSGRITLFVETRLISDSAGRPASHDAEMNGESWRRGFPGLRSMRLAARVSSEKDWDAQELLGEVVSLPHYVGARALVLAAPKLIRAVDAAVASSDVVVARLPGVIGMLAIFSATLRRKQRVVELVGDIGEVLRARAGGRYAYFFARLAEVATSWSVQRASAVRYVTRQILQSKYPAQAGAAQISLSDVRVQEIVTNRNLGLVEPDLILAIGSQEQLYKGHQFLIEAIALVAQEVPNVQLELIGEGRYQDQLKVAAEMLGVSDRVRFCGFIGDRDEVFGRIDACEVFAMPSLTEGLPRALIEAMSRGVPCVGTRVGGIPELLDESALCRPGDAADLSRVLVQQLKSNRLRREQGVRNAVRAGEYSWGLLSEGTRTWSETIGLLADRAQVGTE